MWVSFRELTFFLSLLCLNRGFKMTTGRWKSYIRRTNLMPDHFWCRQCGQGKQAQKKEEGRCGIGSEKNPVPIDFIRSNRCQATIGIGFTLRRTTIHYPEWCWASFLDSISNQKHVFFSDLSCFSNLFHGLVLSFKASFFVFCKTTFFHRWFYPKPQNSTEFFKQRWFQQQQQW